MNDPHSTTSSPPPPELARKWFSDIVDNLSSRVHDFETDLNILDDELLELFSQEIKQSIEELQQGIQENSVEIIRDRAHSLQGMGGVAGAPEVSVVGEELSLAARAGRMDQCQKLWTALNGWYQEWLQPRPEQKSVKESMPTLSGKILVVDDELPNRRFLETLLTDCGADVLLAENGTEALHMIRTHQPDVALVDVVMPGIQGYEVCEQVYQNQDIYHTSVIMVTAKSSPEDVEHAFLKGAFDYIRKPFHSRELVARVRNALLLKQHNDALQSWKVRMSRELEMAGTVQKALFDPTPMFGTSYDYRVSYRSSQHVGGDMFDLHHLADGRLLGYMADVAGHGVGSALISTLIKGLINEILSSLSDPSLQDIGNELHKRYRLNVKDPELYATMILVLLDPVTGKGETLSCGHPPPLVLDPSGKILPDFIPEKGGMGIGMMPAGFGLPYEPEDVIPFEMPSGSSILLYTDGLIEARNERNEECGTAGLIETIEKSPFQQDHAVPDPDQILDNLLSLNFNLTMDDCSLMVIHLIPPETVLDCGYCPLAMENITRLADRLSVLLEQDNWYPDDVMLIKLLIIEHAANIVKHGNVSPESTLFFRLTTSPEGCQIIMKDPGYAWNRTSKIEQKSGQTDLYAENGRGLDLIQQISPKAEHFRRDKENISIYPFDRQFAEHLVSNLEPSDEETA
jgi:serine phosphatase RsbU (regulator of sigma subunit)/anti-sigma regulatory factor (Ser/Thr protein kinase)/HPt (histidine-containing phosphotransfer) domain-containing protein